jgi:hypothetical protein
MDYMTDQTTPTNQDAVRLPILKMAGLSVLACVMIGIGGGSIGIIRGGDMNAGLLTIAAMLPGVLMTLMALNVLPARPAGMWGIPVLAGTMIRVGIVAVVGFGLYLMVEPVKELYVLTLLASVLVVLALDVVIVMSLVKNHSNATVELSNEMLAPEGQA